MRISIGGLRHRAMASTALAGLALAGGVLAGPALAQDQAQPQAQAQAPQLYALEAQPLADALRAIGRQSGRDIMFPASAVKGKVAPRLSGRYAADDAIRAVLAGSALDADFRADLVIIRGRAAPPAALRAAAADTDEIVITGSRIRGAQSASPVILRTQAEMKAQGLNSLPDVLRTIPQNFGGGQNPGIGLTVPESSGANVGGGSTVNLRGIGSSATLTLLNGHRLAYNLNTQGIDYSAIPFNAVDRVEIVADGASALYGSDAVAGVVNIILKRDYDGLGASARYGASTDGGNEQQQYGAIAGRRWTGGGLYVAYEHGRDGAIMAGQRDYAAQVSPGATLFPAQSRHVAVVSAHQEFAADVRLDLEGLYHHRRSHKRYAVLATGDYAANGFGSDYESESFALAPTLHVDPAPGWTLSLVGLYGEDRSVYRTVSSFAGSETTDTMGCYCNRALSLELTGEGVVFALPGGPAKIAYGGGFRANRLVARRWVGSAQNIRARQDSRFLFAELSLPLAGPGTITLLDRLTVSAALRYEDYGTIGDVLSPKLGVIAAPLEGVELMASWGSSFKAPTLYQMHNIVGATLVRAASQSAAGYPASATVITLSGGNPHLRPERASTWTVTARVRPAALEGATFELSYFNISYRDRIVSPITYPSRALSDPVYAALVTLNPSPADQATVLSGVDLFNNFLGQPYDPLQVVAITNNINLNVARQDLQGVDASISYALALGDGTLSVNASAAYLDSDQQLIAGQDRVRLAGMLFNPPHLRARASLGWAGPALSLSAALSYIGPVDDARTKPTVEIGAFTSADLTARYSLRRAAGPFRETVLFLSAQNLLNEKPSPIRTSAVYETPYDSTNVTPIGRFVTFGIETTW